MQVAFSRLSLQYPPLLQGYRLHLNTSMSLAYNDAACLALSCKRFKVLKVKARAGRGAQTLLFYITGTTI